MDSVQHPKAHARRCERSCRTLLIPHLSSQVSTDILEAAGRDPRYLPLLPVLFAVPDGNPYPNIVDNFYALYDAEAKYPDDLQHCQSTNPSHPPRPHTNYFVVFNPCLQLDPRGITPFLPYVIHGDLVSLLDDDDNVPFTSEGTVRFLD